MKDLAHRIKKARLQAGQSQSDLADKTRLTQQMISKLERGESRSTSAIFAIAHALNVSAEWLWLGDGCEQPEPFLNHDPSLARAWRTLSEDQRSEISRHILSLSEKPTTEDNSQEAP